MRQVPTSDGYSPRWVAALLMPVLIGGLGLLFRALPRLDPKGANYEKFLDTYRLLTNAVLLFLLGVHGVVLATGLGVRVGMTTLLLVGTGALLACLGNYLSRIEPNWFVGVRTPWTLSSDTVWRKTHRTAGWVFVLGGLALASAAFLPPAALGPFVGASIGLMVGVPVVQSYVLWKREQGDRR